MSTRFQYSRRQFLGMAVMAVVAVGLSINAVTIAQIERSNEKSHLPVKNELSSLLKANGWLNTQPLTAANLKGKVVLIDFWTYTCINWMRAQPYVREWAKKYKEQGLVVIGVHTPEFSFEENFNNIQTAVKDLNVDYAVAIDNDREIWKAFNNNYWPALYFIDAKGKIRHQHFGEGAYEESEKMIQKLLSETSATNISKELVTVHPTAVEAEADWANLQSSENYLGYGRTENFASRGGVQFNKRKVYAIPAQMKLNQWALSGDWSMHEEKIVLEKVGGRIAYRFHARDLHLVMGPASPGNSVKFRVLIDGIAPAVAHGSDVDENGYGTITEQRMYQLIRQTTPIVDRQFEIEFIGTGAEVFAFTFG